MKTRLINIDNNGLKPKSIVETNGEYFYLKTFTYDDNNKISVTFYHLTNVSEDPDVKDFKIVPSKNSDNTYSYIVSDNKAFTDYNGFLVYKKDSTTGELLEEVVDVKDEEDNVIGQETRYLLRLDDFTRNYNYFADLIIPAIGLDISNFMGYHLNSNNDIDIVKSTTVE